MKLSKDKRILIGTLSVFVITIVFAITYAVFTQSLNINGSGVVRNSSWNIHFVTSGAYINAGKLKPSNSLSSSTKILSDPTISNTTIGDYSVSLTTPGDTIEYTFEVINEGDYNAKITGFSLPTPTCTGTDTDSNTNVCNKLSYTLKYDNGATVQTDDMIASKETKTMVLTLTYQEFNESNLLPTSDVTIGNLGFTINYSQVDSALVNSNGSTPYTYQTYNVGDYLTIHNEGYYVLSNHDTYVTLLKDNPLTVDEVNLYGGVGTDHNHVNKYPPLSIGTADNHNGYGVMQYYSSSICGQINGYWVNSGCTNDYKESDIKYVVDSWTSEKFTNNELAVDSVGYKTRLITNEELESLGYVYNGSDYPFNNNVPNWIYNSQYCYWTMTPGRDSYKVWHFFNDGSVTDNTIYYSGAVRPVINVYKSKL